MSRRALRVLRYLVLLLLIVASTTAMTLFHYLHGSLPVLEGNHIVPGLRAKVDVARDEQGVPTLTGAHREDIAFGLGYLHAQERFFQMDLLRRQPAGELAELLGAGSLGADRQRRRYQMRALAGRILTEASVQQRSIIESYSRGVNQGLQGLSQPPFEYLLLQSQPQPWQPEDSVLSLLALFLQQQEPNLMRPLSLEIMQDRLPADWHDFLLQARGDWEAPLITDHQGPGEQALPTSPLAPWLEAAPATFPLPQTSRPGGSAFAASGNLTTDGRALVASDLHMPLQLPSTWYRARWHAPDSGHWVTGLTLPGNPALISGTNEHLAWALTNALAANSELIRLQVRNDTYRTADGWEPFREQSEAIAIRGSSPQIMNTRHTRWGPVVGQDDAGNWLALRWSTLTTDGMDLNLLDLEGATGFAEALQAVGSGLPAQNLMLAERNGAIAWALTGSARSPTVDRIRRGEDLTSEWPDSDPADRPLVTQRDQLWTANNRTLDTADTRLSGPFQLGARARQIRDRLQALDSADEAALLDIQLDQQAWLLERWRTHLLQQTERTERTLNSALQAELESGQALTAGPDSLAYPLVRAYRQAVLDRTLGPLYAELAGSSRDFQPEQVVQTVEYPLWALTEAAPERALNPAFDSWEALWEDALEAAVVATTAEFGPTTWAGQNEAVLRHPLSDLAPGLAPLLNLPADGLPGDYHMPRVQTPDLGTTHRMVVAPGRETDGLFHMAGGQSGHPISPYYRSGHGDWLEAAPTAFLPGPMRYQLSLLPQR